jgi:hypothetical protein
LRKRVIFFFRERGLSVMSILVERRHEIAAPLLKHRYLRSFRGSFFKRNAGNEHHILLRSDFYAGRVRGVP